MKVTFLSPGLDLEALPGDNGWRLISEFRVAVDFDTIVVPVGFETDLASVPRLPLAYWLAGGRGRRAAVVHDYLYATRKPKAYADNVFYAAMLADGISRPIAWSMYLAVHLFGGAAYKGHEPINDSEPVPPS